MKTINFFKNISAIITILVFMLVLNSCKKTDIDNNSITSPEDTKAAIVKAIKEKHGNISAGVITNVNRDPKDLFYRDAATGNMLKIDKSTTNSSLCNYNCGNTNNPGDLHLVYTLSYVQRNYICESGDKSDINVSWTISVPFTPLVTYSFFTSSGTLKLTDPGSTLHTYSGLAITIRTIGADPGCSANTLYEISYQVTQVPNSYFGSGMLMDASLSLYNDCAIVGNLITTGDVSAVDQHLEPYLPCFRVDKVWINPYLGPSSCATATGNYNICSYPFGFAPIDNHQIEYRQVNSGSSLEWDDQTSTVYYGRNTTTSNLQPTVGPYQVSNLENMISGNWLVRYRNVKTSVCEVIGSTPNDDWGDRFFWVVEYWPI